MQKTKAESGINARRAAQSSKENALDYRITTILAKLV